MGKRERIFTELNRLPEEDLDSLLAFLELIRKQHCEDKATAQPVEREPAPDEVWAWANW
jgi:hypothetical protein